jgi:hypothetical protein
MARADGGIREVEGMRTRIDAELVDGEARVKLLRVEGEQLYGDRE